MLVQHYFVIIYITDQNRRDPTKVGFDTSLTMCPEDGAAYIDAFDLALANKRAIQEKYPQLDDAALSIEQHSCKPHVESACRRIKEDSSALRATLLAANKS